MEKNDKRVVIKYMYMKGLTVNETLADMQQVLGDNAPSFSTIYRWFGEFQQGRQSLADKRRPGRPLKKGTHDNVKHVQDI